jgi:hypothetical protein
MVLCIFKQYFFLLATLFIIVDVVYMSENILYLPAYLLVPEIIHPRYN